MTLGDEGSTRRPSSADELVEVVDPDGQVIEVVTRAAMRAGGLRHRCVYIAVVDSRRRLLVHQRSFDKDVCAGWWDVAAGGVCGVGERWSEAAQRELAEELGIDVELTEIGGDTWDGDGVRVVGRMFLARSDGPFSFTDGEILQARVVDVAGLDALLASEPVCPDSVALVLPLVRAHLA